MNWYAVRTKPRQEVTALRNLTRERVETFRPQLRRRRTIRRVRRWTTESLFPNYIFARFDAETSHRLVKHANGVAGVVGFGGKPVAIEDTIITELRNRAEDGLITLPPLQFKPGEAVIIQEGPLRGLQAIFDRPLSGPQRVAVLLNLITGQARVEVALDSLSRAE